MDATKEELKVAFKDLLQDPEFRQTVRDELGQRNSHTTPAVQAFKQDIQAWLDKSFAKDDYKARNGNRNALYVVLRTKLGLGNIQNLRDGQIPEARQIFDEYKHLLSD